MIKTGHLNERGLLKLRQFLNRTFVRTVNGSPPDNSGNVEIDVPLPGPELNIANGTGTQSIKESGATRAGGSYSHAEGYSTSATNHSAHAEGHSSVASGTYSHAEGYNTRAEAQGSHAEGYQGHATGNYGSHAEGDTTLATGAASHSEGERTLAKGVASHAEGRFTEATGQSQHVFGEYNVRDESAIGNIGQSVGKGTYVEIVGNGVDSDHRSNARTLDWNGNEVLAGQITATQFNGSSAGLTGIVKSVNGETPDNNGNVVITANVAYGIGDVYISTNATSPAAKFGGTWERIEGRFLLGATDSGSTGTNLLKTASAAAGATGGEAAHTLAGEEAAQKELTITGGGHSHTATFYHDQSGKGKAIPANSSYFTWNSGVKYTSSKMADRNQTTSAVVNSPTHTHTVSASNAGASHNTMPPFLAVYIWTRVA